MSAHPGLVVAPETAWQPEEPTRILFSGLTASCKTTYSKLTAAGFDRPWFDATTILKSLAGLSHIDNDELWNTEAALKIQEAREGDELDRKLDALIMQKTQDASGVVVDAWALPWLWEGEAVRVFVDADFDTRVKRCMGSMSLVGEATSAKAEKLVTEKDAYTRDLFHRLYGFDIFVEHEIFDFTLDTSGFIPDTAEKSGAQIAIDRLLPIVRTAIMAADRSSNPA